MRVLIINTDYPTFLSWLYDNRPNLSTASYNEQLKARNLSLFGVADFYSRNLRELGHEAWDVHANNEIMQRAWATEHGLTAISGANSAVKTFIEKTRPLTLNTPLKQLKPLLRPLVRRLNGQSGLLEILSVQIRHYKPDVLLNQAMEEIPDDFLRRVKPHVRLMVGQVASPLNAQTNFRSYDLVISSLPNFVDYFRKQGVAASLSRFAFEPSILGRLGPANRNIGLSFVGSLSDDHSARSQLLHTIDSQFDIDVWGPGAPAIRHHHGPAWGVEMYTVLNRSRMTLNHHISIAKNFANNMRLFEATGMGCLLVTDRKDNLHEMFEPGREVAVYGSQAECSEMIRYYMEHDSERETIARSGQQRTLRDHNYKVRMRELSELFERHINQKSARIAT